MSNQLPFIETQFDELQTLDFLSGLNLEKGYSIVPQLHASWKGSKRRILFVIESMDGNDIREGALFSSVQAEGRRGERNHMIATMRNVLKQSWKLYQEYIGVNSLAQEPSRPEFSIGFVNFNAARYFGMEGVQRQNVLMRCANRVREVIAKLKPTDVVIFGDTASHLLVQHPSKEWLHHKRGVPLEATIGGKPYKVTCSLDLEPLYNTSGTDTSSEDSGDDASGLADLLYFVCRNLCNAYAGKHLHQIDCSEPKISFVNTIEKARLLFDRLDALEEGDDLGFDMETENLEAYNNKIYTAQFAFNKTRAYVLPVQHPVSSPWNGEELEEIKTRFKRFMGRRKRRVNLTGANLQFDVKVCRGQFDIPVVHHRIWDVAAGEMDLDENIALFDRTSFIIGSQTGVKTTLGNLRAIVTHYGCDFYWTAAFSKEHRTTFGQVNLNENRDALMYAAFDAVSVLRVKDAQIDRARYIRLSKTVTYEKKYVVHVLNQMSNTCHSISTMHQNGAHVSLDYFDFLASDESPILKLMASTEEELMSMPAVKEANSRLLAATGTRSKMLFGNKPVWMFDMTKGDGLAQLFFGVLGLKALNISKKTGAPSIDKKFLTEYAPLHPEVGAVQQWRIAQKLVSTYIKSWANKVRTRLDSSIDHCLRPSFGFFIVTSRLNSFDPNLQQAPSKGKIAKYIKEAFRARRGRMNLAWDFNAAEVRWAANLSGDKGLAENFLIGTRLRQSLLKETDADKRKEIIKEIKTKGDVHVLSVWKFFKQWVDKDHPLRAAVKAVVFGVLYGKSSKTLSGDLQGEARYRHRDNIMALEKQVAALEHELKTLVGTRVKERVSA